MKNDDEVHCIISSNQLSKAFKLNFSFFLALNYEYLNINQTSFIIDLSISDSLPTFILTIIF